MEYKFEFDDDKEGCNDSEINIDSYDDKQLNINAGTAINADLDSEMGENLLGRKDVHNELNSSMISSHSSSSSVSVTPRAGGGNSFKYKCCSICLTDFESGVKVKVLPNCGHTFHGDCLEQWLTRQFRCPNC